MCLHVCPSVNIFFADAPSQLVLLPLTALLGHPVQNNVFALIEQIFLQPLVLLILIIFRNH